MNQKTIITLDFETDDPYIGEDKGAGWVFTGPESRFKVLGAAIQIDQMPSEWITDWDLLSLILSTCTDIVCHNAQYDIGVLQFLGIDYNHLVIHDTMLLAKLLNNDLLSYNLDSVGNHYGLGGKQQDKLGEVARELKLIKNKTQDPIKVAKKNMGLIYAQAPTVVAEYAIADVNLTATIFYKLLYLVNTEKQTIFYSDLIKALVKSRAKGVRIDLNKAREVREFLVREEQEAFMKLDQMAPGCNFNSAKQLAEVFDSNGWNYPLTDKGSPSFKGEWLEEQTDNPLAATLCRYKKFNKIRNDFLDTVLEGTNESEEYKTVYPEINIFGATATGRASSSHPNIQQIPKRDPELGKLVRTIYVPNEGETWFSLDFASQESRIQIHYAYLIAAEGARTLVAAFRKNPALDIHGMVAKLAKISRDQAKTINLGLSYGMGLPKLADSLGMTLGKAKMFLKEFHQRLPYLKALTNACQTTALHRGYIKTIGGRRLRIENKFVFKAMNKLVQGSAADQTWAAIVLAYRAGIPILFPVHDELCYSGNIETALRLKDIMETCTPLELPMLAEVSMGPNWGEVKIYDTTSTSAEEGTKPRVSTS